MANQNFEDQITKYQNANIVVEFNDHMFPSPIESAASLHAKYSKIEVVVVDTSKGKKENAVILKANVDPIKIKCLYDKVKEIKQLNLNNEAKPIDDQNSGNSTPTESILGMGKYKSLTPSAALAKYKDEAKKDLEGLIKTILEPNVDKYPNNKVKIAEIKNAISAYEKGILKEPEEAPSNLAPTTIFSEKKVNPNENKKNKKGEYPVTVLEIEYNPRMRNPFIINIENGWSQIEPQKNGGMAIKAGTYRKEKEVKKIVMSNDDFRQKLRQVNDYIMYKEQFFLNNLIPQLNKIKEKRFEELAKQKK